MTNKNVGTEGHCDWGDKRDELIERVGDHIDSLVYTRNVLSTKECNQEANKIISLCLESFKAEAVDAVNKLIYKESIGDPSSLTADERVSNFRMKLLIKAIQQIGKE